MEKQYGNILSEQEKKAYVAALTAELPFLRMKAGISQGEIAEAVGISRQTYGSLERGDRSMGWGTYLSLIFFFDNNSATHRIIRGMDAFPHKFIDRIGETENDPEKIYAGISSGSGDIFDKLDEQAVNSIRTMIMIEYARCTNQSGDAVVRSFNGRNFLDYSQKKEAVSEAIRHLKESGGKNGK